MREALLTYVISGFVALLIGCGNERSDAVEPPHAGTKISREMLRAHGFKQSKHKTSAFVAEHVRLAVIAKELGLDRA